MSFGKTLSIILLALFAVVHASHFRGGTITWRPMNNTPSGSTLQIQVRQRYSWRRGLVPCTNAMITNQSLIGDFSSVPCYSGTCTGWSSLNTQTSCTDFSAGFDVSSGEKADLRTVNLGISFSIGFVSGAWFANLVVGGNSNWNVITRINTVVRTDGYINSSPVAATVPIIYKAVGVTHSYAVRLSDFDGTDILRCRWATSNTTNFNTFNECGGVCNGVPSAVLFGNNCTLRFLLTTANWYAAVAFQIEDYYNAAATTPMSSVGLQFLFYGYNASIGCNAQPVIIGDRANRDCISVGIGQNITEYVIAQVSCSGKTIIDFITTTPLNMMKSAIQNSSTGNFQIVLSWIPTTAQRGPQSFCAIAADNTNIHSNEWCITFLVDDQSSNVIRPRVVRGSGSPSGTILQNRTAFSIQTSIQTVRPIRNGTYIYFRNAATNAVVQSYDCAWASEIVYTGTTIYIAFSVAPWVPGNSYYVTFDNGVVRPIEFCGPGSAQVTDPTFWSFNISNSGLLSTTTSTTTTSTRSTTTTSTTRTTTTSTSGIVTTMTSSTIGTPTTTASPTTTANTQTTTMGTIITTVTATNTAVTSMNITTTAVRATCATSAATTAVFNWMMTMTILIVILYI